MDQNRFFKVKSRFDAPPDYPEEEDDEAPPFGFDLYG